MPAPAPLYGYLDAKNIAPGITAVALTPADGADLAVVPARFLYIGVAGTLKVDTAAGDTVTFSNVAAGQLNLSVKRVYSTGTSATGIIAIY